MIEQSDPGRVERCRQAVREVYGTADDEVGATLFVNHHLEELSSDYWVTHFGTASPPASAVIDGLIPVRAHAERDGKGYSVDFSLPGGVTNYMVSVQVDGNDVADVTMES